MSPELFKKWEEIVDDVDKIKIPVQFIKKLIIKLDNRRQRTLNIQSLIKSGHEFDEIEEIIADKLRELDEEMNSIEFILDIENIAETVQPTTDDILKNL
jgi:acid phosphatase class B